MQRAAFHRFWLPIAGLAALGASPAFSEPAGNPLATLQGKWTWVSDRDKLGLEKACAERWEQFESSADGRQLKNHFPGGEGDGYVVLYQERNRVTLYLNKEKRRLNATDRVIWVAIVEAPDRFRWRVYAAVDAAAEHRRVRVRCPS